MNPLDLFHDTYGIELQRASPLFYYMDCEIIFDDMKQFMSQCYDE